MIPCCCGCSSYEDDFSTDTTGTEYSVVSGSFSHGSGEITTTSATPLLIADKTLPAERGSVNVVAKSTVVGNTIRLVGNYLNSNNYLYARFAVDAGFPAGSIQIYKRTAGSDSLLGTTSVNISGDTYYLFTFCWGSDYAAASVSSLTTGRIASREVATTPHSGGLQGGLGGTRSSGTLHFSSFSIHASVEDSAECPSCSAACDSTEYIDAFDDTDPGWGAAQPPATNGAVWSVADGVITLERTTIVGTTGTAVVRCATRPSSMTGVVITQQAVMETFDTVAPSSGTGAYSICIVNTTNFTSFMTRLAAFYSGDTGTGWDCIAGGSNDFVSGSPAAGDILTVVIEEDSGTYDVSFYVNLTLISTLTAVTLSFNDPFFHGTAIGGTGEITAVDFDDYEFLIE